MKMILITLLLGLGIHAHAQEFSSQASDQQEAVSSEADFGRDDGDCYLDRYPDICRNSSMYCANPARHYSDHGAREGRIWGCFGNPGRPGHGGPGFPGRPGRPGHGHPGRTDAQCYLNRYPDICRNSSKYCADPYRHYREHGQYENRFWGCRGF